jgi:DNA-binding NtrC family response regulator
MARILLVDDDADFSEDLQNQLRTDGHEVLWVSLAEEGLRLLAAHDPFDLVLLDNRMPGMSGLEFLTAALERGIRTPIILITSAHTDSTVIQAINRGAFAYVPKPDMSDDLLTKLGPVISEALEVSRRPRPVPIRPSDARNEEDESVIVGHSKPMLDVLVHIGRLARIDETVLILGETGTGKDLVARAIHTNSPRKDKNFVVMNCTALNENLLDDELFGHEPHAFTGADKLRKGRFEHAQGGTLMLDEVGDMPLTLQAKLLRVLENREIVRVGSNEPIRIDVRVLAATHRDLKTLVREGRFREDLFFRLEGLTIHLPPLRERKEDIELLARRFLDRMFGGSSSAPTLHPAALARLRSHPWPGNIRQLQKVLCRAAGACRGAQISPEDLDFGELDAGPPSVVDTPVNEEAALAALRRAIRWAWQSERPDIWPLLQQMLEHELLRHALAQPGISQVQLARRLGVARNTLRLRLKQYGLEEPADGDA